MLLFDVESLSSWCLVCESSVAVAWQNEVQLRIRAALRGVKCLVSAFPIRYGCILAILHTVLQKHGGI